MKKVHSSALATLIGIKTISSRPYKINIEVRLSTSGYSVTIVSRDAKVLTGVAQRLRESDYRYAVYVDDYGFIRLHLRNLGLQDVAYIEKIVRETASKRKHIEESVFALAS